MLPCSQLIFGSKTWFFGIYLNFFSSSRNHLISHILKSKCYQINSIKSCSSRSFQQHPRQNSQFLWKISAMMQFSFQWRHHSIFKNFCTTSPNVMEPRKPMHSSLRAFWRRHEEHDLKHPGSVDLITTKPPITLVKFLWVLKNYY